jgi:hypothetical protein
MAGESHPEAGSGRADESRPGLQPGDSGKADSGQGGSDLDRRYPIALLLYGVLGLLVWFTLGEGTVVVLGKQVELRIIPLVVIGSFVLRTVLARQADRIRRGGS